MARHNAELNIGTGAPIRPRRRWRWFRRVLLGLLLLGLIGFGVFWWFARGPGSLYWLLASYQDDYSPKIAQWNRLMTRLPPLGSVTSDECRRDLNPKPSYIKQGDVGNCEIYQRTHEFELQQADWRTTPSFFLLTEGALTHGVGWYNSPGIEMFKWGSPRSERVETNLKLGLQKLYLVIYRPRIYEPAREVGGTRVQGGLLEFEGIMYDLRSEEKIGQLVITSEPSPNFGVRVNRTRSSDGESDVVASARDSMVINARTQLLAKLRDLTGGEFEW